jgi:hypothetical protein
MVGPKFGDWGMSTDKRCKMDVNRISRNVVVQGPSLSRCLGHTPTGGKMVPAYIPRYVSDVRRTAITPKFR